MSGTMWAESAGVPGRGATFHFTLRAEAAPAPVRVYLRGRRPELSGKRILVVDDHPTNRRIISLQTQTWGMLPTEAATPSQALALLQGGDTFDLAILDMQLPEMDGAALAEAICELRSAPRLAPLITAVGMSFIVQNIGLALYGVNYRTVPNFIPRTNVFHIGGITYSWSKASVLIIVIPLLILLSWFVRSTKQGKAMRAVAQDTEASAMMGIDVNRTISVTFLLAGALAGAAGIVYLLQFNMRYDTGFELGLIAFTAAVLGGIGNLTGAVLGALIIGFIQAFNEGLGWHAPGSDWTRTMVFGILILILVFRPEGILGEQTPEGA